MAYLSINLYFETMCLKISSLPISWLHFFPYFVESFYSIWVFTISPSKVWLKGPCPISCMIPANVIVKMADACSSSETFSYLSGLFFISKVMNVFAKCPVPKQCSNRVWVAPGKTWDKTPSCLMYLSFWNSGVSIKYQILFSNRMIVVSNEYLILNYAGRKYFLIFV